MERIKISDFERICKAVSSLTQKGKNEQTNMRYLIITNSHEPFYTEWFTSENSWINGCEMVVFDLFKKQHTTNGKNWIETKEDHL